MFKTFVLLLRHFFVEKRNSVQIICVTTCQCVCFIVFRKSIVQTEERSRATPRDPGQTWKGQDIGQIERCQEKSHARSNQEMKHTEKGQEMTGQEMICQETKDQEMKGQEVKGQEVKGQETKYLEMNHGERGQERE